MSASAFLRPGGAVPAPVPPRPRRRVFLFFPAAAGAALLLHWLDRPGAPVPRPGPRRFPPLARGIEPPPG